MPIGLRPRFEVWTSWCSGIAIAIALLSVVLLITPAQSEKLSVHEGESIQSVIDSALSGDTVVITSGSYFERVIVNKPLSIVGTDTGSGLPALNAGGNGSCITVRSPDVRIEGLAVTGSGSSDKDAGILATASMMVGKSVFAYKNGNAGILLKDASNCSVVDCILSDNRQGIRLVSSSNNLISECNISENRMEGIVLDNNSGKNSILGNQISGSQFGILMRISRGNTVSGNNLTNNKNGLYIVNHDQGAEMQEAKKPSDKIGRTGQKGVYIKYTPAQSNSENVSDIDLQSTIANLIFNNTLLDNSLNAFDDGINEWDNGTIGNRYGNYDVPEEGCRDHDHNEICDKGLEIVGGSSIDRRPLAPPEAIKPRFAASGEGGAYITLDKGVYRPGTAISVGYSLPFNFTGFVGITKAELPHGEGRQTDMIFVQSLAVGGSGSIGLDTPSHEGSYAVRVYSSTDLSAAADSRHGGVILGDELVSREFRVKVPEISVSDDNVITCQKVDVSYSGAPGLEDDWIGLFRESDPDSGPLSRKYLEGSDNGSIEFYLPEAGGKYNFRMFEGDSFERLAETRALEVKASSGVHVTATPETAKVGQKITVSFWGGPEGRGGVIGMYIMTKADKFYMQMKNLDGRRCGTLTFVPPGPGKYDFRMFQNNVYRQLMGQSNVVTVS